MGASTCDQLDLVVSSPGKGLARAWHGPGATSVALLTRLITADNS